MTRVPGIVIGCHAVFRRPVCWS